MNQLHRQQFMAQVCCVLILLSLMARTSYAWGGTGHRTVARIAAKHLTTKTRAAIKAILNSDQEDLDQCRKYSSLEDQLACVSVWADEIRDGDKFPQYKNTSNLHYVNVPIYLPKDQRHYVQDRDCRRGCIVTGIETYRQILINSSNPADRATALKFLVHFIGDLHQPLHTAVDKDADLNRAENLAESHKHLNDDGTGDRGGNLKLVTWFGEGQNKYGCVNLHSVWDDGIISRRGLKDRQYANLLNRQLGTSNLRVLQAGSVVDWLNHALELAANHAYFLPPPNSDDKICSVRKDDKRECDTYNPVNCREEEVHYRYHLGPRYYKRNLSNVEAQLKAGGIHLARFLNEIFDPKR